MSKIEGSWEYYRDTWHDEDTVMHVRDPQSPVATVYTGLDDARKIAAVNELLEACEVKERMWLGFPLSREDHADLEWEFETKVKAALAKARGET